MVVLIKMHFHVLGYLYTVRSVNSTNNIDFSISKCTIIVVVLVVLPDPSEGWGRGRNPRRPNSRATPQGLDQRSRIEREEPKIDLRRGSEAGQSRRK